MYIACLVFNAANRTYDGLTDVMARTLIRVNHFDVAASDFNHFEPPKKQLVASRFVTNADVKQAVTTWLQTLDTDFLCAGIQAMMPLVQILK